MNAAYTQIQLREAELQSHYSTAILSGNRKLDIEGVEEKVRFLFSHNITLLRSVLGFRLQASPLSQAELAELMALALPTVNKWENGVAIPNRSVLTRLVGHINSILMPTPPVQEADVLFTSLMRTFMPGALYERTPSFVPQPLFGSEALFLYCTFSRGEIVFHQGTAHAFMLLTLSDIIWEKEWNDIIDPIEYVLQSGVSVSALFSVVIHGHKRFFDVTLTPQIHDSLVHCIGMDVTDRHNRYRAFKQTLDATTLRMADMTIDYQQQRLRALEAQKAKERSDNRCDILRSMADNAVNCLLVIDNKGIIVEANMRSVALFGADTDIIGHSFFEIVFSGDHDNTAMEEMMNGIGHHGFMRRVLQVQGQSIIAVFSPVWAGGLEYYIVALQSSVDGNLNQ